MKKYKCHKVVEAAKITKIASNHNRSQDLFFEEDPDYKVDPMNVDEDWVFRHKPEIGGYYVRYEAGYGSYSPAEAFESGYSLMVEEPST